jgi:hypothetical protein
VIVLQVQVANFSLFNVEVMRQLPLIEMLHVPAQFNLVLEMRGGGGHFQPSVL